MRRAIAVVSVVLILIFCLAAATQIDWKSQIKNMPPGFAALANASPTNGQVVSFNGTQWVAGSAGGNAATGYSLLTTFQYSLTPGGSLTGGGGPQTVTLSVCPLGIYSPALTAWSPIYISAGVGVAETVTPSDGTCKSATLGSQGGTVIISPVNSHSGSFTFTSATAGLQEAFYNGDAPVYAPCGQYTVYTTVVIPLTSAGVRGCAAGSNNYGTGSFFNFPFTNADWIQSTNSQQLTIQDVSLYGSAGPPTSGSGCAIDLIANGGIAQIRQIKSSSIYNSWNGICSQATLRVSGTFVGYSNKGFWGGNATVASGAIIENSYFEQDAGMAVTGSTGIYFQQTTGVVLSSIVIGGPNDYCISLDGSAANTPVNEGNASNIYCDGFGVGGLATTYPASATIATWNWAGLTIYDSGTGPSGYCIGLSNAVKAWTISGLECGYGNQGGIRIDGAKNVTVTGGNIYAATGEVATTPGIFILNSHAGTTNVNFTGLSIGYNVAGVNGNQGFVNTLSGLAGLTLVSNHFNPAITTPITLVGNETDTIIHDNGGVDNVSPSVASAATLALPVNPRFNLTGTTGVTAITVPWGANAFTWTFIPSGAVAFTAGATIYNSCTTTGNTPYTLNYDGSKTAISGKGC